MTQSAAPVVSIITATRNRAVWLAQCLRSLAGQTQPDFEALVMDDGSDQPTRAAYAEIWRGLDERFVLDQPSVPDVPGSGPSHARNRGLTRARGRYVAFLDDDDRWIASDHLALAVELMDRHQADLYFTNIQGENAGRVTIPDWFPACPQLVRGPRIHQNPPVYEVSLPALAQTMRRHYPHPDSCVIRRSVLEKTGLFWEAVSAAEDVDLVLRVAEQARRILYRAQPVVGYNVAPRSSVSSRTAKQDRFLICALALQHTRAVCTHPVIRRTARAIEAWNLRCLAQELHKQGRRRAAASFAWQALALYPTAGAAATWLRVVVR